MNILIGTIYVILNANKNFIVEHDDAHLMVLICVTID